MAMMRRVRAAILITVVCGLFWGLAAAVGRAGYELIVGGLRPGFWATAFRMFLIGATLGTVGGALYTVGLALVGQRKEGGLSGARAALLGALAGFGVFVGLRAWGIMLPNGPAPIVASLIPALVLALLGAGMGFALLRTAHRATPSLEEKPSRSLGPPPGRDR